MSEDPRKLDGYVGFANLPNQVHRKSVKRGFEFTMMAVGESGLGKSTLINSLFQTTLYEERQYPSAQERIEKTVEVSSTTVEIEEKGVKLRLTVVDSPGFGDAVNNEGCWNEIEKYVDSKFEEYFNNEYRVNRGKYADNRVHACLYFVPPNGHGLRPVDIAFMKRLHRKVNIIPIIAKADTLTAEEVKHLKQKIIQDVNANEIQVYRVPLDDEDDEADYEENKAIQESMPFAVIGSTTTVEVNGKQFAGRQYPWGVISIQDPQHSDFVKLRNFIIRTHYVDLTETTEALYENFRAAQLNNLGLGKEGENPLRALEAARGRGVQKLAHSETELHDTFQRKVQEKEHDLQRDEDDLVAKTRQMEEKLARQKKELEDMQKRFQEMQAESQQMEKAAGETKKKGKK